MTSHREAAKADVKGWRSIKERFDDGGVPVGFARPARR